MDDAPWVSEALYVGLCHKIGAPTYVTFRRELMGMKEMIQRPIEKYFKSGNAETGSYREGFRLNSSDIDLMIWTTTVKLITEMSNFDGSNLDTLFMEQSYTPHGYVRLKLLNPPQHYKALPYVVKHTNGYYISSEKMGKVIYHGLFKYRMFT